MESVLRRHPEHDIPFCVKSWQILDLATGLLIFEEKDNYLARREIVVDTFTTSMLGIQILEIHGGHSVYGGLFEVRAYES
jgi:hypothetical protein